LVLLAAFELLVSPDMLQTMPLGLEEFLTTIGINDMKVRNSRPFYLMLRAHMA